MNLQELNNDELQNIRGGLWWEIVGAALGIVLAAGEIAEQFGHTVGEAYAESQGNP